MDLVESLDRTFQHAHGVIAGARPDQYGDRTPCEEWSVRDLLEHLIGVVAGLGAAAAGAQFEEAAAAALAAWRRPGVLDQIFDAGPGPMPGRVLAGINLPGHGHA